MNAPRAKGIAIWSRVLLGCVAAAVVLTAVRVAQLKVAPSEQLVRSMERPSGQLVQQRAAEEPEPRGRIVDRAGRLLALDSVGGRLFVDVKDLYTDALAAAERAERKARRAANAKDADTDDDAGQDDAGQNDAGRNDGPEANTREGKTPARLAAAALPPLDPIAELASQLSRPLGMSASEIAAAIYAKVPEDLRLLRRGVSDNGMTAEDWKRLPRFVIVAESLNEAQLDALAEAKRIAGPRGIVRGAHVQPKSVRLRPFEELAVALIGRTRSDGVGQSGAEHRDDRELAAKPGRTLYFADSYGQVISVPADGHLAGRPGDDVRLSIDMVVQEIVEREVNRTVVDSNSGGARCLVVSVDTGEILAAYDTLRGGTGRSSIAEDPSRRTDPALARLRWVTDPFEPGSIFKPFVWAWALEIGKARAKETIHLPDGPLTVTDGRARRTIKEAHNSSYGTKSWHDVLTKSVNAGMATVALRMTTQEMKDGLAAFGFGKKTGVGLGGESVGIMPPAEEWKNRTRAQVSVSFGQGIAVTPLQLLHAFSAFCRDGSMAPLTLEVRGPRPQAGLPRAVGESAMLATRDAMQDVIREGTGKKLKDILRYTAFGKSGTAQLVNPKGGYFEGRYISSFIIGAPFDDPKIAVLVTIEDPDKVKTKGAYGGGALAGPCAAHIVNGALEYLGVPTDGELVYSDKKKDDSKKDEKKLAAAR